jgi:hypothetical protein
MFKSTRALACLGITTAMLVACGGGGGGDSVPTATGPTISTLSFPLQTGVNAAAANGGTKTLTAYGTPSTIIKDGRCSGTITPTTGPAIAGTTFEGKAALSATTVIKLNFTNCTPASNVATGTYYYDSNYTRLGNVDQDGSYRVYEIPPTVPTSVKVGSVGIIGIEKAFTNSVKSTLTGRSDESYVVEPDAADTAIVNLIRKQYDASSKLILTEQDRYRISSVGTMTAISVDIQSGTDSQEHYVFR